MSLTTIQRMAVAVSIFGAPVKSIAAEDNLKEALGYCAFEAVSAIGIPGAEHEILQQVSGENDTVTITGGRLKLETPQGDISVEAQAVNDERISIEAQHPNLDTGIDHTAILKIDYSEGKISERWSSPGRNSIDRKSSNLAQLWAIQASEVVEVEAMKCLEVDSAHLERSIHAAITLGPPPYIKPLADDLILTE